MAEQADNDALRAAVAFRNTLVQKGVIKEKKPERPGGVKGVDWHQCDDKCWQVQVEQVRFKPLDDTPGEIEKARLLAVAKRQELEKKYFAVQVSGLERQERPPPVERKSGMKGVFWRATGSWCAYVVKKQFFKTFTPKDDSPEEMSAAA